MQSYAENIYKIRFLPDNYKTNENVSDAVLLSPTTYKASYALRMRNDTLYFPNGLLTLVHREYADGN